MQHPALARDGLSHNHIKSRQAIACDHEQMRIAYSIEIADLTPSDKRQRSYRRLKKRLGTTLLILCGFAHCWRPWVLRCIAIVSDRRCCGM
jgi:hypothetical protein